MIGKPEWFTYRIFGWGLSPKTKEGWLYILAGFAIAGIIAILPISAGLKSKLIMGLVMLIILDVLHIMLKLDKFHDEREKLHQLIIERNSSFAAVGAIGAIILYQAIANAGKPWPYDMSLFIVLGAMVLAKAATTLYVSQKM